MTREGGTTWEKYTRFEWETLETSGKHSKLHSKRVGKTRDEWETLETTLETSGKDSKLH